MLVNLLTSLATTPTIAEEFLNSAIGNIPSEKIPEEKLAEIKKDSFESAPATPEEESKTTETKTANSSTSVFDILKKVTGYSLEGVAQGISSALQIPASKEPEVKSEPIKEDVESKNSEEKKESSSNWFGWIGNTITEGISTIGSFFADPVGSIINIANNITESNFYNSLIKIPGLGTLVTAINDNIVQPLKKIAFDAFDYVSKELGLSSTNYDLEKALEKREEQKRLDKEKQEQERYEDQVQAARLEEQKREQQRLDEQRHQQQLAQAEADEQRRQQEIYYAEQVAKANAEEKAAEERREEETKLAEAKKEKAQAEEITAAPIDKRLLAIAEYSGIEIDPCCTSNAEFINHLLKVISPSDLASALSLEGRDTSALYNNLAKAGKQGKFKDALSQLVIGGSLDTKNILPA